MTSWKRPTVKLKVEHVKAIYHETEGPEGLQASWLYNVVFAHLQGARDRKYVLIDHYRLASRGICELSVRPLSEDELKRLLTYPATQTWYRPDMKLYRVQPPIDLRKYFAERDWPKTLELWLTEGLEKDARLLKSVKAIMIPLEGDPTRVQPLNAHSIWCLNTGVGKSTFAYIMGSEPLIDPGVAGLLGSYTETRYGPQVIPGALNGAGPPLLFDEISTIKEPLITRLLTYMENGYVTRRLKVPITVSGTRTLIFASNPPRDDDLAYSLAHVLKLIASAESPERVGRRIGFLLVGNDYKVVEGQGDASLRAEVPLVIQSARAEHPGAIRRLLEERLDWIMEADPDVEKSVREYAKACPKELPGRLKDILPRFLKGHAMAVVRKLKTSALRYLILERLDQFPKPEFSISELEDVYRRLFEVNESTYRNLSYLLEKTSDPREFALKLREKYPTLGLRSIAEIVGVSHETVRKWIIKGEA